MSEIRRGIVFPGAVWVPSPNFTPGRSVKVDRVVVHITDGNARLDRAVEHLCNREAEHRVSSHFLVGQLGEVVQLVELGDTAWHASGINARSVGIEHIARTPREFGRADKGLRLTEAQLLVSIALVRWVCDRLQIPVDDEHVIPHTAVPGTTHRDCGLDEELGGIWPWREYRAELERQQKEGRPPLNLEALLADEHLQQSLSPAPTNLAQILDLLEQNAEK